MAIYVLAVPRVVSNVSVLRACVGINRVSYEYGGRRIAVVVVVIVVRCTVNVLSPWAPIVKHSRTCTHVPGKRFAADLRDYYVPAVENENEKEMLQEIRVTDAQRYINMRSIIIL
jgi:hypothetical protein